jgi:hypothetical protein
MIDNINDWFRSNSSLNLNKTYFLQFRPKNSYEINMNISCGNKLIKETKNTKFLGLDIDSTLTHTLNTDILRMVYFAYFHPILQYRIIFGGNSAHAQQVFKLQKRVVRVMSGMGPRSSCRNLCKKTQYSICPMSVHIIFNAVYNQQDFFANVHVHSLDTRNKNHLYLPAQSLTCVQKGISCSGVKIFNSLPSNIQSYKGNRKKFKKELCRYLAIRLFYSITEFLECKTNKRNA